MLFSPTVNCLENSVETEVKPDWSERRKELEAQLPSQRKNSRICLYGGCGFLILGILLIAFSPAIPSDQYLLLTALAFVCGGGLLLLVLLTYGITRCELWLAKKLEEYQKRPR